MRFALVLMAATVVGCAAHSTAPPISADRHAANIAAAEQAGYKVVSGGDRTLFCPTAPPTGSHMGPTCVTEAQFQAQLGAPRSKSSAAHFTNQSPGEAAAAGH